MPAERTLPPGDLQRPHDWPRSLARLTRSAGLSTAARGVRNAYALYSNANTNSDANQDTYAYAVVASQSSKCRQIHACADICLSEAGGSRCGSDCPPGGEGEYHA